MQFVAQIEHMLIKGQLILVQKKQGLRRVVECFIFI